MSLYELSRLGFDHEYGCTEDRAEVWVDRQARVLVEWFSLEVGE
jgi:hypothetical protein